MECLKDKAGMAGVDKSHVKKIVEEMSKGSKFYLSEKRKEIELEMKVKIAKEKLAKIREEGELTENLKKRALRKLEEFKLARKSRIEDNGLKNWPQDVPVFCHVDLDMFFCAVELLDEEDPTIRDKPVAVVGAQIVATANYEARKFGIRAAMPLFIAQKLCPNLITIKPHFEKYKDKSFYFKQVLQNHDSSYDPKSSSLDEGSLDLTESLKGKSILEIENYVKEIRSQIFINTKGLTCSAGIAPSRILAKIWSDRLKPNGQSLLHPLRVDLEMADLAVSKIPGIGRVSGALLEGLGLMKCSDVWKNPHFLLHLFPTNTGDTMLASLVGTDKSSLEIFSSSSSDKGNSISCERTFTPTNDLVEICARLLFIVKKLSKDLKENEKASRRFALKIKDDNFQTNQITEGTLCATNEIETLRTLAFTMLRKFLSHQNPSFQNLTITQLQELSEAGGSTQSDYDEENRSNASPPKQFGPITIRLIGMAAYNCTKPEKIKKLVLTSRNSKEEENYTPISGSKRAAPPDLMQWLRTKSLRTENYSRIQVIDVDSD